MGLYISPDNFLEKINELRYDLEYIRAYIDDALIIGNDSFGYHQNKVK